MNYMIYMMWQHSLILLICCVLLVVSSNSSCPFQCFGKQNCVDNLEPVKRTLGHTGAYLCYRRDTCFNESSTENIPVQQKPLNLLAGQDLYFDFGELNLSTFSLKIFSSGVYQNFESCNESQSAIVNYANINNQTIKIPTSYLTVGIYYFILSSDNIFLECRFGLRLKITVHNHTCKFQNQSFCSAHGQCLLNKSANLFQCECCDQYNGDICDEYNGCLSKQISCYNDGTCNDVINGSSPGFTCLCKEQFNGSFCKNCITGFHGVHCLDDINECNTTKNICNFGSCINTNGSFYCVCPVNVTGQYCDIDLYDNCQSSPCNASNSTCIDRYNGYTCQCPVDFTGVNCETRYNACLEGKCYPEGTESCIDGVGSYTCKCIDGYTGVHCEVNINDCEPAKPPCKNGALCVDLLAAYECHCLPGYDGKHCENVANKCEVLDPCKNNATCVRIGTNLRDYNCLCKPGWENKNCSSEVNQCQLLNPCENNSTCFTSFNNYTCDCTSGWTGRNCTSNINVCVDNPCQNNSTCIDSLIGLDYTCDCLLGFSGKNCSTNIDDCINVNCNNGICIDLVNDSYCKCNLTWFGNNCDVNQDYCANSPCLNSISCENINRTPGFKCTCKTGFSGLSCVNNIDDCLNNTCKNGAVCVDLINAYNCSCPPGYEGQFCENDINECLTKPCHNNATCQDLVNQYFCKCLQGFTGKDCGVDINECLQMPCKNNATCIDRVNNYTCKCLSGFTGMHCDIHFCDLTNICQNNGTCEKTEDGYQCNCPKEFTGEHCENSTNECLSFPCKNNASCVDLYNGFKCDCIFPYSGMLCDTHKCNTSVCQNNATCIALPDNYQCQCVPGYTGINCETNVNECHINVCNVNGTKQCIDKVNAYKCLCYKGYSGTHCDKHECDLITNICNNGSCIRNQQGYNCSCKPGYTGLHCEKDINECANVTCGKGICMDKVDNFTCVCPFPQTGRYCEDNINLCGITPCLHNSTCLWHPSNSSYTCQCKHPYSGTHCGNHICNSTSPCNNGTCIPTLYNYTCNCDHGYTSDDCSVEINECKTKPCQNNGSCVNMPGGYKCTCLKRYTGTNCENALNYCNSTACLNGGSCFEDYDNKKFICACSSSYTGQRCESRLSICFNQTCSSNGICVEENLGGYNCNCSLGFSGKDCKVFNCPCLNGRCVRHNNSLSYQCLCQEGYTGQYCEVFAGDCRNVSQQCTLQSYCKLTDYGYTCICPSHLQGQKCDRAGSCPLRPCKNNGTCIGTTSIKCDCQPGYTGVFCQFDMNECSSSPCFNNGSCAEDGVNSFKCYCPYGFTGNLCEISTMSSPMSQLGSSMFSSLGTGSLSLLTESTGFVIISSVSLKSIQTSWSSPVILSATTINLHHSTQSFQPTGSYQLSTYELQTKSIASKLINTHSYLLVSSDVEIPSSEGKHQPSLQTVHVTTTSKDIEVNSTMNIEVISTPISPTQYTSMFTKIQTSNLQLLPSTATVMETMTPKSDVFNKNSSLQTLLKPSSKAQKSIPILSLTSTLGIISTDKITPSVSINHLKSSQKSGLFTSWYNKSDLASSTIKNTSESTYTSTRSDAPSSTQLTTPFKNSVVTTRLHQSSQLLRYSSTTSFVESTSINSMPINEHTSSLSLPRTVILNSSSILMYSSIYIDSHNSTLTLISHVYNSTYSSILDVSKTLLTSPSKVVTTSSSVPTTTSTTTQTPTTTSRPYMNLTCIDVPCNGYTCINETDNGLSFRCICPYPTVGPRCSIVSIIHYPRFNGYSFLELKPISLNAKTFIMVMVLHTTATNGLLLYANHNVFKDFIEMFIDDGHVAVSLSTGADVITVKSRGRINNGKLSAVSFLVDTETRLVTLNVNKQDSVSKIIASNLKRIQLTSSWFIGGTPSNVASNNSAINFTGCIKELSVNGKPYQLTDVSNALNWTSIGDCDISICERGICQNNATCITDHTDLNNYDCQCNTGYRGPTCKDKFTDHCFGEQCSGGICVWTPNGRHCLCQYGRFGVSCLIDNVILAPYFSTFLNYSSYMEYPWLNTVRNAKERLEVRLQFKVDLSSGSSLSNSLLLYVGQSTVGAPNDDFFALGIINRYIYFIFNLGSGLTLLKSKQEINKQRNWHFIVAGRTTQHGYLYIDSQKKVEVSSSGVMSSLDVFTPFYIGGVPDFSKLPGSLRSYFYQGFTGWIQDMAFRAANIQYISLLTLTKSQCSSDMIGVPVEGGLNVGNLGQDYCDESNNPCANNGTCEKTGTGFQCKCQSPYKGILCNDKDITCVDYNPCSAGSSCQSNGFSVQCDCPYSKSGTFCEKDLDITIPRFTKNSYLSLSPSNIKVRSVFIMQVTFKSQQSNGLLFYTSHNMDALNSGDFFAVSLWKKYVYVRFNLGYHTSSMRSREKINLYQWHSLYIRREAKDAIMQLDQNYMIGVKSSGSMTMLDVASDFYVGGVPLLSAINVAALKDVQSQHDFMGCIKYLKVNDYVFNLTSYNPSSNGRNLVQCETYCMQNQCQNNGECLPSVDTTQGKKNYTCICPLGYLGDFCDKDAKNITSVFFSSSSYWFTRIRSFSVDLYAELKLKFKTSLEEGLILWSGRLRDSTSDHIGIGITKGKLKISYLLNGHEVSAITENTYNDSIEHQLIVTRIGNTLQFFVNGHMPKILRNNIVKEYMTTDGYVYIGGLPGSVKELTGGRFISGFTGCLSNVILTSDQNIIDFSINKSAEGFGLGECSV